jgi:ribosome-binding protein aMBF1 (putative translation factor)
MKSKIRSYSFDVKKTLAILADAIKVGRKQRGMSEQDLADRIGASRSTVRRIEKADPKCEIGVYLEAAHIVGITLIGDPLEKARLATSVQATLQLLPKRIKTQSKKVELKDDF